MFIKKRAIITIILTIAITFLLLSLIDCLNNKCLIVISIFLSFLFFYKIFDYIANFKTIENKSRIDIVFLFIFFIWLFIPMSHIKHRSTSYLIRRPEAQFKSFFVNNKINYNFGTNFDSFFNDRFFLKDDLIKFYNQTSIALLRKTSTGNIYEDWVYSNSYKSQKYDSNNFENLVKFNTFCANHNIKLYILIVPSKNDIYLPNKSGVLINKSQKNLYDEVNKYRNKLNIIYPYDELMMNKNNQYMFYKTEHHWTDDGAFIGYQTLMKEINKDFKEIKPVNQNDYTFFENNLVRGGTFDRKFHYGTTCSYIGLSKKQFPKYHKTKYRYYKHKNYDKLRCNINDSDFRREKLFYYPKGADKRVILLGTSQSESLCEFIPFTFKNVKRIRNNTGKIPKNDEFKIMKYYKSEILEDKPDILIFCITKENVENLNNMFNME